jgi:hypothetical protein
MKSVVLFIARIRIRNTFSSPDRNPGKSAADQSGFLPGQRQMHTDCIGFYLVKDRLTNVVSYENKSG